LLDLQELVDTTHLVAWRAWHERNEATHDKPLPSTEGSCRFLCGYLKLRKNVETVSTYTILKGKQPSMETAAASVARQWNKKPQDKPWLIPPTGLVKLNLDGSKLRMEREVLV
jgi:hypothetical protein